MDLVKGQYFFYLIRLANELGDVLKEIEDHPSHKKLDEIIEDLILGIDYFQKKGRQHDEYFGEGN